MVTETMAEHRQAVQDDIAQLRADISQELYKSTVTAEAGLQTVSNDLARLTGRVATLERAVERFAPEQLATLTGQVSSMEKLMMELSARNMELDADIATLRISQENVVAAKVRRRPPALGPLSPPTLPVAEKHFQEATVSQPGTSSRKYLDSQGRVVDGQALSKSAPQGPV